MLFIVSQIVVLVIIIVLLYLLTWILPTDSPWAPWWATSTEASRALCKLVKLSKKDTFYELGSGTGTTVTVAAKDFGATCTGIESSVTRVWWSQLKARLAGVSERTTFLRADFFRIKLSPATVVYLYLVPRVIKKLKPKLLKELKPGTKVVSHVYPITYLPQIAENKKHKFFVYTIPEK